MPSEGPAGLISPIKPFDSAYQQLYLLGFNVLLFCVETLYLHLQPSYPLAVLQIVFAHGAYYIFELY